jgi:hypothetical protein
MATAQARYARAPSRWRARLRTVPLKKLSVSLFFVAHVVAIVSWSLPYKSSAKRLIDTITAPYMQFTGLWQGWDMFAPDPLKEQQRLDATVTFADGRSAAWEFPLMHKLGMFERYPKERYRKWSQDNVRVDEKAPLWRPTARFVARQFADSDHTIVHVEFHRFWQPVPPPGGDAASQWRGATFYRTDVRPEPQ